MTQNTNGHFIPTTNAPPAEQLRAAYRIIRTPTGGTLDMLVLSDAIYGVDCHYYQGRTRPHTQPTCEPCDIGVPYRWQGYLAVMMTRLRDLALFEFTAASAAPLVEYYETNKTLRGVQIKAARVNSRANGRVILQVTRGDLGLYAAPPAPDVNEILARIWQVPRLLAHEAQRATERAQEQHRLATGQPLPDPQTRKDPKPK